MRKGADPEKQRLITLRHYAKKAGLSLDEYQAVARNQAQKVCPVSQTSKSTTGAIGELVVCADLMRRGFHVYRSMSPACPCDLVIWKGSKILRVEVKTAYYNVVGAIKQPSVPKHQQDMLDILAIVTPDGIIHYQPPDDVS